MQAPKTEVSARRLWPVLYACGGVVRLIVRLVLQFVLQFVVQFVVHGDANECVESELISRF